MDVVKYSPSEWHAVSEEAHKICFKEIRPRDWDRIDFALLTISFSGGLPTGYVTCQEFDAETVYWQFGGAFPGTKGTVFSLEAFQSLVEYCRTRYKRITFVVVNDNFPMLKLAQKGGFKIIGVRNFAGAILLEHILEFEGQDAVSCESI